MSTTTRSAVAAAALTLSVSPLLLTPTASAEPVGVADAAVSSSERDVGARTARELELELYLDRLDAAAREARSGAGQVTSPVAPARTGDDGVPVSVVTLLTLGGLAAGAGATIGLRRVHVPGRRPVAA